jgi:hypothetical protein
VEHVETASDNQRRELEAVAERSGWKVVQVYQDAGISGAKGRDQRPGLDAVMKAVNRKEFDMVAAWSVDRLKAIRHFGASPHTFKRRGESSAIASCSIQTSLRGARQRRRRLRQPFDAERAVENLIDMTAGALSAPVSIEVSRRIQP